MSRVVLDEGKRKSCETYYDVASKTSLGMAWILLDNAEMSDEQHQSHRLLLNFFQVYLSRFFGKKEKVGRNMSLE